MTSHREDIHVNFTTQDTTPGLFRSPSWNAKRDKAWSWSVPYVDPPRSSPSLADFGSFDLEDIELVRLVAMDLLASCHTINTFVIGGPPPGVFYDDRDYGMITALEMHRRKLSCPAAGHHAREPSIVRHWPGLSYGEDREEQLATQYTGGRKLKEIQRESSGEEVFW